MKPTIALALLAAVLCSSTIAVAEPWPELEEIPTVEESGPNDVAVIVAVEDYAFLPDVPGATKNAADWERFLADGLGVPTVLMLTNQQAVREEILTFAERAAAAASTDSTVWFVFIGHGAPNSDADDGLLVGADGQQNAKSMAARGVPQKELLSALEKGDQARTVVLFDACFSGRDGSGEALAKGTMPVLPINNAPTVATGTVVMTAAKADEFAGDLPGAERPAFSYLVLGAMRGWADDGDGTVTADEAVTYARRQLLGIAGRQQTPQLLGATDASLTRGVTETTPPVAAATTDAARPPSEPAATATTTTAEPEDPKLSDGVPDSPFYAFAAAGPAVVDNFSTFGVGGDFGVGVKFNGFSGGPNEWRLGLRVGLSNSQNNSAPQSGELTGNGEEVFADDDVQDTGVFTWMVGPEVGRAWRSESGGGLFGDSVFVLSAFGVYASQPSVCDVWNLDTSSGQREISCAQSSSNAGPGGGISAAANLGIFRIGALFGFAVDVDLIGALTLGLTFDS